MIPQTLQEFKRFNIKNHQMPNAIGMWPNEIECFLWALENSSGGDWLEIGSFCGGSAVLMALARKNLGRNNQIHCVDIDFNPMFDYNIKVQGRFENIIQHKVNSTNLVLPEDTKISFAFIDGYHSFKQVITDFRVIYPYLTNSSIIAFHDVSPKIFSPLYRVQLLTDMFVSNKAEEIWKNNNHEDFLLDEAVIMLMHDNLEEVAFYSCPLRREVNHQQETGLKEWVRGKTSPTNSICFLHCLKQI